MYQKITDPIAINRVLNSSSPENYVKGYDGQYLDVAPFVKRGAMAYLTPDYLSAALFIPVENSADVHVSRSPYTSVFTLMRMCKFLVRYLLLIGVFEKIFAWIPHEDRMARKLTENSGLRLEKTEMHDFGFGVPQMASYHEVTKCRLLS